MSEVQYTVRDAINRLKAVNALGKTNLSDKGVDLPADEPTTIDVVDGIEDIPTGALLNIEYGNTAPSDTTKLWIKSAEPENVTVDYDIDNGTDSFQQMSATLPSAARMPACGVVGKKCYVFGGGGNAMLNTINIYDTETNTVTTSQTTLPVGMEGIACGVVGTKCYLFGGYGNSYVNTILVYDTIADTITTLTATLPTVAYNIACGVIGDKCYLFGGRTSNNNLKTINVFDTTTNTITTLQTQFSTGINGLLCSSIGTKCYLFGNGTNTVTVFDSETQTLSTASATLPTTIRSAFCGTVGTKCYLIGGFNSSYTRLRTVIVYDSLLDTAETLATTLPSDMGDGACGSVGNCCYLFCGNGGSAYLNTIGRFMITFPLNENDIYIQEDTLKNQFTLISEPTKVVTGVSNVYVGNSNNEAEKCEAYLHDGTDWQEI